MAIDVHVNNGVPNLSEVGSGRVTSTETCVFWRAARHVLNEGKPASENVVVCVPGRRDTSYPLFIMTITKAKQLICWLAFPERVCAPEDEHRLHLIDHVTLDLRNRRSHSSAYDPIGGKHPTAVSWKLHAFPENGVSLWFGFALRRSAVENQVLERHQWIRFPTADVQRRKSEYVRFFEKLRFVDAHRPMDDAPSVDTLLGLIYVVDNARVTLSHELLQPISQFPNDIWDAPARQQTFNFKSTGFSVGSVQLGLLLGVPPLALREDGPFLATPRNDRTSKCSTH